MSKLKVAVIGAGYLGKFHVRKYHEMENADLVAVSDVSEEVRVGIEKEYNVKTFANYKDVVNMVDAVSIAVPTEYHYDVAKFFLSNKKHVLLEKPICRTIEEAKELNKLAEENKVVFQIGHIERFNSAFVKSSEHLNAPVFIESHRLSPFSARSTDVDVVLDLMIHDLDIALHIAKSEPVKVESVGTCVISKDKVDIANARISFASGCIANITASRVTNQKVRKVRVFQDNKYLSIDFLGGSFDVYTKEPTSKDGFEKIDAIPDVYKMTVGIDKGDALKDEIHAFVDCVVNNKKPLVTGKDGEKALTLAYKILEEMRR